ncbi:hypothetical protein PAXRUDRAFT_140693 [Paxillus rubicundulus Ve08.2h10]|uniref:Uncharacterized protein n=1 Tax=Paxillus rubicundulus Ve08.2h10 TaxID=930991 RepID=A0A0D0DYU0_9AGAM|nr:hypothetical protein PAXRUDRAFT_140693 [Paxillus rubicundulus Ve08.2h10]
MKFIAVLTALVTVVPAVLGQMTINTPASVIECEPTQFSWSGGTPVYYLSLVPAGQPSAPPFKQFPTQSGTEYTWNTDLGSGTSFTISLKDSTGLTAYSDIVTIQAGSDSSCLNSTVSEGGSTSGSAAPSQTSSGASGSSNTGSVASATPSAAGTSQTNAASRLTMSASFGVAGVMGLIGSALF